MRASRLVVLVGFGLSGASALAYEVIWTRSLSVVLGSTTHALASMLATFMLGLAIGGLIGGRIADRVNGPLRIAAYCELGIGVLGLGTMLLIPDLPGAYLWVYRATHLREGAFFAMQIGLCSAIMLLPTIFMGMTFPLVTRAVADATAHVGTAVGTAYGANTLGSVAGSLLAGFVLVPDLGLRWSAIAAAAANACVAFIFLVRARALRATVAVPALAALAAIAAAVPWDDDGPSLVSFYTASRYLHGDAANVVEQVHRATLPVFEEEGVDGRVVAFRDRGNLLLVVGGKIEGTQEADRTNALLLAYLPVAAHRDARSMLVVGLGAGVTLEASRRAVAAVDLVEINSGVLHAVARYGPRYVLDGIAVHRDDARSFLLRTDRRYDVISSEPSYPTDFSVGNLFSAEYYRLAARRLTDGGIYCQWFPYYLLTNADVTMMLKTFGSVFPHGSLWKVPESEDLLMLGSMRPFAWDEPSIRRRVASLHAGSTPLEFVLSRNPEQISEIVKRPDVPVDTDDHPILEFRVARNLRVGDLSLLER